LFLGKDKTKEKIGWDNIHWWGGYKDYHIPSAPGAFHAAHLHWRWGLRLQTKDKIPFIDPKFKGEPQFRGAILGGPLVDPLILFQDIEFAVVSKTNLPEDITTHSSENFKDFFIAAKGNRPDDKISEGDDLALYYS